MKEIKAGKYQHYKGGVYQVFGEGIHTETDERFVVYKPLYDVPEPEKLRIRPKKMFLEEVEINGQRMSRFKFIE